MYMYVHVYTPTMCPLCTECMHKKISIISGNSVVPVGEASVMIAVSSEHRKEALEAVSYAIDRVKCTATIWKKAMIIHVYILLFTHHMYIMSCMFTCMLMQEVYEDEDEQWKENKECVWLQT